MIKYPIHVTRAHQIHYASLEEVSKKSYEKRCTSVTTHNKCSKLLQRKMPISCNYTLEFAICTKSMELLKLY